MSSEARFRLFSLLAMTFVFVAVSAVANKSKDMDLMTSHMQLLEEASLINAQALSPQNLTQIGQQKESPVLAKK